MGHLMVLTLPVQVADLVSDVGRIQEAGQDSEKLLQVSPPDLLQDVRIGYIMDAAHTHTHTHLLSWI